MEAMEWTPSMEATVLGQFSRVNAAKTQWFHLPMLVPSTVSFMRILPLDLHVEVHIYTTADSTIQTGCACEMLSNLTITIRYNSFTG